MAQVTFDITVGGDGSTVSDDASPTTGLANGGHRTRLVPAFAQIVAVASWVKTTAQTVLGYKTSAETAATSASSSASTATTQASTATTQASTATTKASEASASATLAQDWAVKTTGPVSGSEYSAKYWAQQTAGVVGVPTPSQPLKFMRVNAAGNAYELASVAETWLNKTTNYTALMGDKIKLASGITVNLPASPTDGATVDIQGDGCSNVAPAYINPNGKTVQGAGGSSATTILITRDSLIYKLVFDATANTWRVSV